MGHLTEYPSKGWYSGWEGKVSMGRQFPVSHRPGGRTLQCHYRHWVPTNTTYPATWWEGISGQGGGWNWVEGRKPVGQFKARRGLRWWQRLPADTIPPLSGLLICANDFAGADQSRGCVGVTQVKGTDVPLFQEDLRLLLLPHKIQQWWAGSIGLGPNLQPNHDSPPTPAQLLFTIWHH